MKNAKGAPPEPASKLRAPKIDLDDITLPN
jgi:hypothetical protein